MKVLYVNIDQDIIGQPDFLRAKHYQVIETTSFGSALELIKADAFDALLIDDSEDLQTVDFTIDARRIRPELPIFVVSAWRADLPMELHSLGTFNLADSSC